MLREATDRSDATLTYGAVLTGKSGASLGISNAVSQPVQVDALSAAASSVGSGSLALLATALKFVFSWIILTPIAIIVSGKMLAHRLMLEPGSKQLFSIRIFRILTVEARNEEVVLGLTGFLVTLLVVGAAGGARAYALFREHFGIDPGQFNSLCVISALFLVVWAFAVYLMAKPFRVRADSRLQEEHAKKIRDLAAKKKGDQ